MLTFYISYILLWTILISVVKLLHSTGFEPATFGSKTDALPAELTVIIPNTYPLKPLSIFGDTPLKHPVILVPCHLDTLMNQEVNPPPLVGGVYIYTIIG